MGVGQASNLTGSLISDQYNSQILNMNQGPFYRQVAIESAQKLAREENLIFLGETSCRDDLNCTSLFDVVIQKVHQIQTDLVRQGKKNIEDLRYGEEERSVNYNRCCY
mmetsp:Transcript_3868/g.6574  ORF Transcript_3868/g.6574 Transcript_3868/m.6574 type:complete len:108 (-) Transcript_3868:93-416(-)